MADRLKLAVIAGEESGDLLGADLVLALRDKVRCAIDLIGIGGKHLAAEGLKSFFDLDEIAIMGIDAILKKMPRLLKLIRQVSFFIAHEKPNCLIIIDSPEFTHRVARKVRGLNPTIPIINYIAPSVWAWRSQRAGGMRSFIDHVLVVLPFEVEVMKTLRGPPATYVGHRLLSCKALLDVCSEREKRGAFLKGSRTVLVLPGSRRFEIRRLMPVFGQAIKELRNKTSDFKIILPTIPRIELEVRALAGLWPIKPDIVVGEEEKWKAFIDADAALAASGTVSLELALCGIPMVLAYRVDWFSKKFIMPRITCWSAALPNIIADQPVVPEYFNEFVRPGILSRHLESYLTNSLSRRAQVENLKRISVLMHTAKPSGEIAVETILPFLYKRPDI
ncbi:MAG: lipid-A-disaccharide synthase [Candidatus Tokpelaia sp. JSC161]|jgi:lipid-A-disaccharide synthase|nr:MAG: lipid-A-disaccharide synthase [Candidatus Tokpelaia sp. JSC161]